MKTILTFTLFLSCAVGLSFCGGGGSNLIPCFIAYGAAHLLLYVLVFYLLVPGRQARCASTRMLANPVLILIAGVALRVCFLPYPAHEDMNRYVWEGRMQLDGGNPFVSAPAEYAEHVAGNPIFDGVTHKDMPTIYGPLVQLVFRGLAALQLGPLSALSAPQVFKLFFLLCDIIAMCLLSLLLRFWRRPMHWLALYAWNPLVLLYAAGEAHFDVIQVLFVVIALCAYSGSPRWRWLIYPALGAAIMVKYVAVVLLPILVTRSNRRYLPLLIVPALAVLPFMHDGMFDSLQMFATAMHYNDLFPKLFRLFPDWAYVPILVAGLLSGLWWTWLLRQAVPVGAMAIACMWLLLSLPTLHPWYLMLLIVFFLYTPSRPWMLLCALMGLQFFVLPDQIGTSEGRPFAWVWAAQFVPMLLIYFRDLNRADLPWQQTSPPPLSIDIVVPTLNEEAGLASFMEALDVATRKLRGVYGDAAPSVKTWIVDGGSTDSTTEIAARYDVEVLHVDRPGRGHQFATGVEAGTGDVIVMLHADATMQPATLCNLQKAFVNHHGLEWGILGHLYAQSSMKMQLIELSNRFRFFVGGIAFGDQGIFARRESLDRVGGMPHIRLMEDVEVSLRLLNCPGRMSLGNSLSVSTRRWQQRKFTGYTLQVLKLVTVYLVRRRLGTDIEVLTDRMYDVYYRQPDNLDVGAP